jgi:predicted phosphodiesterase
MQWVSRKTWIWAARLTLLALATVPLACEMLEYGPHQDNLPDSASQLNRKNIDELLDRPAGDTLRVAFVTDTQNFYDETEDFVDAINARDDVDFVVHGGDITAFGIIREFEWMHEIFAELDVPYLTVIGNHDLKANGGDIYEQVYGPKNFSLVYARTKFVFVDTNSRDYDYNGEVPDLQWLRRQLEPSPAFDQAVVIGHVPPDHREFDPRLEGRYANILEESGHVPVSLYGHQHQYEVSRPYGDVLYLVSDTVGSRQFTLLTLSEEHGVQHRTVNF